MGYFDALASTSFKTAEDGRRLFFLWGPLGRGYVIPSEEQFERLYRQVKIFSIVSTPLIVAAVLWKGLFWALLAAAGLMIWYVVWERLHLRQLDRTDEKLTFAESFANRVRAGSWAHLWLLEAGALAFVGIGVGTLILDSENWPRGIVLIAFFGFCAVEFARMLIAKGREVP
jgi:predicted membrane protein